MALTAPRPDDWRIQQAIVLQSADQAVIRLLKRAQRDINAQLREVRSRPAGVGRDVREAQLNLIRRNLSEQLGKTWRELGNLIEARRAEAVARSINYQQQLDTFTLLSHGVPGGASVAENIARTEAAQSSRGIDNMMARVSGASYVPLSRRVYNSNVGINSQVDRMVNSALARGLSADEFAKGLEQFINPNTPGGIRYAALRLARTEINNAAHAQAVSSVQNNPWVKRMQWHLSGSHTRPDICNRLAEQGPNGDGTYPKEAVPGKPHPQCFCYVTAVTENDDDDDAFLDDLVADYIQEHRTPTNPTGAPVAAAPAPTPTSSTQPPRPGAGNPPPAPTLEEEIRTLEERLRTGIVREEVIGGGTATRVTVLTLGDRSKAIRKLAKLKSKLRAGVEMQDAEELSSLLGRRLGLWVPEVVREDRLTIVMDFEEGRTPDQMSIEDRRAILPTYEGDNPDVIRAALFDVMIQNTDRNGGNYVIRDDGGIALIDHGMAFNMRSDMETVFRGPGFARFIAGEFDKYVGESFGPSDRYSRDDVEFLRQNLTAMRSEFERLDRLDWYDQAHRNLDVLDENARGQDRVFPRTPEAPVEVSEADKTAHAKDLIASGKTLPQVTAELKEKYGLTNGQALVMWQKANKKHKAENAGRPAPAPTRPLSLASEANARSGRSTRVSGGTSPLGLSPDQERHLSSLVRLPEGADREQVLQELRQQNLLVPNVTRELNAVSRATHADRVRAGTPDALAWYQPWNREMFLGDAIFTDRYQNETWHQERAVNWCSRTGHSHSGAQSVVAHEFGHHVHAMLDRLDDRERRSFWDQAAAALGISPPQNIRDESLEEWLEQNKYAIRNQVSKYGSTHPGEMMAEIWQEFSTSGAQSRPAILKIGQLMQQLAERGAGK